MPDVENVNPTGNTTEFTGDVQLNFAQALESLQNFSKLITNINAGAEKLNTSFNNMQFNVIGAFRKELSKWKSEDLFNNTADVGKTLTDNINKAIARNLASRDIMIAGEGKVVKTNLDKTITDKVKKSAEAKAEKIQYEEDLSPLIVKLTKKQMNSISDKINALINTYLDKVVGSMDTLNVSPKSMSRISSEISTKLAEMIDTTANIKIDSKSKFDVVVPAEVVDKLYEQIRTQLYAKLSGGGIVSLDEGTKKIDLGQIVTESITQMQANLQALNDTIQANGTVFSKIAGIQTSLIGLNKYITEVSDVLSTLKTSVGSIPEGVSLSETNVQEIANTLQNLSNGLIDRIRKLIDDSIEAIKTTPISTLDGAEYSRLLKNITDIADNKIRATLNEMLTQLNSTDTTKYKSTLKKDITTSLNSFKNNLNSVLKESVGNYDFSTFRVDMELVQESLDMWLESISKGLQSTINNDLMPISANIVNDGDILASSIRSVANEVDNITHYVEGIAENVSSGIEFDGENVVAKHKPDIENAMDRLVSNFYKGFDKALATALTAGFFSASLQAKIKQAIKDSLANAVIDSSQGIVIEDVDAILRDKIRVAVTDVLKNVKFTTTESGTIDFSDDLYKQLRKTALDSLKQINAQIVRRITESTKVVENSIANTSLNGTTQLLKPAVPPIDVAKLTAPVQKAVVGVAKQYINNLVTSIVSQSKQDFISIPIGSLNKDVKKTIATDLGTTVRDLKKVYPSFGGGDVNYLMEQSYRTIFNTLTKRVMSNMNSYVKTYTDALKNAEIPPDTTAVDLMLKRMQSIQELIVKKVKQLIDKQFKSISKELNNLTVDMMSLNYVPKARVKAPRVPRASRGSVSNISIRNTSPVATPMYYQVNSNVNPLNTMGLNTDLTKNYFTGTTRNKFAVSVMNAMRYMTAFSLVSTPVNLIQNSMAAVTDFEASLAKSRQNFIAKDEQMLGVAQDVIDEAYKYQETVKGNIITMKQYNDPEYMKKLTEGVAKDLRDMSYEGAVKPLQNLAMTYGLSLPEVGNVWSLSSRRLDNPYEALSMTKAITKSYLFERESTTPENIAEGMEALATQWQLSGNAMEQVANMLIKTSSLSQATVDDLLEIQKRSGSIFATNQPNASKSEALASSMVLSSLFVQATGRSADIAGTFWREVFQAPFEKESSKYLENMSKMQGFEKLNPFIERQNAQGQTVYEQKSGVDMFLNIIEATQKMDAKSRNDFIEQLYGKRFGYGTEAIAQLSQAIDKLMGTDVRGLIDAVKNVSPEEIEKLLVATQDTYKYNTQRVQTMFDSTVFSVFKELSGEFTSVSNGIVGFLRVVQDNASLVAESFKLLAKVVIASGITWGVDRLQTYKEGKRQEKIQKEYSKNSSLLNLEGYTYGLERKNLEDNLTKYSEGLVRMQQQKLPVINMKARYEYNQSTIAQKMEETKAKAQGLQEVGDTAGYEAQMRRLASLQKAYDNVTVEVEKYNKQLQALEAREKVMQNEATQIQQQIGLVDVKMGDLAKRMTLLDMAYSEMSNRNITMTQEMAFLSKGMSTGTVSLADYNRHIDSLAQRAGVTKEKLTNLRKEVDKLVADMTSGKISINEMALSLQALERSYNIKNLGVKSEVANKKGGATTGDLITTVATASMFGSAMKTAGKGGTASKLVGGLLTTVAGSKIGQSIGSLFGKVGGSAVGKVGGSILGKSVGIAKGIFGKAGPLLLITIATELLADPLTSAFMNEYERLESEATKKQSMLNLANSAVNSKNVISKALNWGFFVFNSLRDSITHLLGGTAPSFQEYMTTYKKMVGKSEDFSDYISSETEKTNAKLVEARVKSNEAQAKIDAETQRQNELAESAMKIDYSTLFSTEQGQDIVNKVQQDVTDRLNEVESKYKIDVAKFQLKGFADDSKQLRDLMDKFLKDNIEILKDSVDELTKQRTNLEKAQPDTYKNTDAWKVLNQAVLDSQAQLYDNMVKQAENSYSEVDSVLNDLEQKRSLAQAEYGIKKSDLLLGGASEESFAVKNIDKQQVQTENKYIADTIKNLQNLMQKYSEGDSRRDRIFLEIKQLQAESKDNLVKIYKTISNQSTFNLPSDITPVTYWEAMTSKSNYKNMTVRSGDVIVNLTIGSMNGDTKSIDTVAQKVSQAVSNVQRHVSDTLSNNVLSGMARSYRPAY